MRVLGIDYGHKRIGLAISDETSTFARELKIVSPKEFWKAVLSILAEYEIVLIVVGLPLASSGGDSNKTREVRDFATQLETKTHSKVELFDERLSSVMARHLPGGSRQVDSLAAQIILQNFLDTKHKKAL